VEELSWLLNAWVANDIRQTVMHTTEPLVYQPNPSEVEIAIENLERYKLPTIYQIPVQLIQAGTKHHILSFTNLLILFGIRKNCHGSGRNLLLYVFVKRVVKLTIVILEGYHYYQLNTKFYPSFFSQCISVDFNVTVQLLIRYSMFVRYWRKMGV
jgi:hypothetical protein